MVQRKLDCKQYRREKQNGIIIYHKNLQDEHYHNWFKLEVSCAKTEGEDIDENVLVLSLPPSSQATSYRSMYAFKNHIRVHSAERTLTTVDSGVAATFSQNCWSGVHAKNLKAANLEYVWSMKKYWPWTMVDMNWLCCIVIG
jgi:hypothetical protein